MAITSTPTVLSIELGVIGLLVVRAHFRQQLTPGGILAALLTGLAHAIHPWSVFFILLVTFFAGGTAVTKVNHTRKASLTTSPAGNIANAPHPRTAMQVFCNSAPATVAILLHWLYIDTTINMAPGFLTHHGTSVCLPHPRITPPSVAGAPSIITVLPYAVFAHYAAVAADTFASELGILARSSPVLVTAPWRKVPRGTNGGITLAGILASALGAGTIGVAMLFATPFCKGRSPDQEELRTAYLHSYTAKGTEDGQRLWTFNETLVLVGLTIAIGVFGGLLDSVLGALLQASVVDAHTGKIVEGEGGVKVHYSSAHPSGAKVKAEENGKGGRKLIVGRDLLSNNGVNLTMSLLTSLVALVSVAIYMGLTIGSLAKEGQSLYEFGKLYISAKTK